MSTQKSAHLSIQDRFGLLIADVTASFSLFVGATNLSTVELTYLSRFMDDAFPDAEYSIAPSQTRVFGGDVMLTCEITLSSNVGMMDLRPGIGINSYLFTTHTYSGAHRDIKDAIAEYRGQAHQSIVTQPDALLKALNFTETQSAQISTFINQYLLGTSA